HGRPSRLERRPHALPFIRREQPRPHGPLDERVRHDRLRLKPPPRPLEGRGGWHCGWPVRYWHGRAQRPSWSARVCSTVCSIFDCRSLGKRLAATTIENTNI